MCVAVIDVCVFKNVAQEPVTDGSSPFNHARARHPAVCCNAKLYRVHTHPQVNPLHHGRVVPAACNVRPACVFEGVPQVYGPSSHSHLPPPPAVPLGPIPQQGIMREAATRAALKQLRKRGSGPVETGFATYTADIAAGWHTELASWRFRQAVLAEFLGTAIFVCILVCAVIFYPLGYDEEVGGSARG